ncbi:avidin/streptavidin family protein [Methylobacterium sp. E-045]|uniref:avidin/streptavidin family protein n=1 Tax=Methylobacterium sp. E-045 TaxID=2836575 RepID=UPI001FBBB928|nr:avidin/streptavidin family protein [Methylobacterium sp. E-045]MCJ2128744.1 avidin/streptavidin family protein [Methylobacterium sp. E-045]
MFSGTWCNEAGDELHLTQYGEAIAGTYIETKKDTDVSCRSKIVVGSVADETICFVTGASTARMMKSWTGLLYKDNKNCELEINTVCHSLERLTDEMEIAKSISIKKDKFKKLD